MENLSPNSKTRLATCHPTLQLLFNEVAKKIPINISCGHRDKEEQNRCFRVGTSMIPWPKSRHNSLPSMAVDVEPLPINWEDLAAYKHLSSIVWTTAEELGIQDQIEWGGNWKMRDYPHWQLKENKGE